MIVDDDHDDDDDEDDDGDDVVDAPDEEHHVHALDSAANCRRYRGSGCGCCSVTAAAFAAA